MTNYLNLNVSEDVMIKLIAAKLGAFRFEANDEVTRQQMQAHLNGGCIDPMFAHSFEVSASAEALLEASVLVRYITGGIACEVQIGPNEIEDACSDQADEFALLLESSARLAKLTVNLGREMVGTDGSRQRQLSIANTHFQEGFRALRSLEETDPDAY